MIVRLHRIALALMVSIGFTAVFIANLAQAQQAAKGNAVYCVVPVSETPGPFAPCDAVFQSIQTAVSAADDGSEVWVAGGLYTDVHFINMFSSQILLVTPSLTIRGGYTPPFTSPPDSLANPTILDAQGQAYVIRLLSPDVTLEGLHITGGHDHIGAVWVEGGTTATLNHNVIYENQGAFGIAIVHSTAVLNNNIIRDNIGRLTGDNIFGSVAGGGIASAQSHLTLDGNTIVGNVALSRTGPLNVEAYGGGLWAEDSVITMTNNLILSNTAVLSGTPPGTFQNYDGYGGGIALINSPALIKGNEVRGNTAVYRGLSGLGGGLYVQGNQTLLITENSFVSNTAAVYETHGDSSMGGGLYLELAAAGGLTPAITVADNLIQGNTAVISGGLGVGGGMAVDSIDEIALSSYIYHNRFFSNTAIVTGVIGVGGGLFLGNANATLAKNQFLGNAASIGARVIDVGGALHTILGQVSLNGDLFQGNKADAAEIAVGGGIGLGLGQLSLTNTVLIDNQAGSAGSALATIGGPSQLSLQHTTIANNQGGNGSAILIDDGRIIYEPPGDMIQVLMTNTILVSHTIGISVTGNHTITAAGLLWYNTITPVLPGPEAMVTLSQEVTGDPRFAADGYHIAAGSAAIGSGVPSPVPLDIDGEGRPFLPALGADEFWPYKFYFPLIQR